MGGAIVSQVSSQARPAELGPLALIVAAPILQVQSNLQDLANRLDLSRSQEAAAEGAVVRAARDT